MGLLYRILDFDELLFSKRELRMLRGLADEFRDTQADDMIEATHLVWSALH